MTSSVNTIVAIGRGCVSLTSAAGHHASASAATCAASRSPPVSRGRIQPTVRATPPDIGRPSTMRYSKCWVNSGAENVSAGPTFAGSTVRHDGASGGTRSSHAVGPAPRRVAARTATACSLTAPSCVSCARVVETLLPVRRTSTVISVGPWVIGIGIWAVTERTVRVRSSVRSSIARITEAIARPPNDPRFIPQPSGT